MKSKIKPRWKDFGDLLKSERSHWKMSRKELAVNLKKTVHTIRSWEQGYRRPRQSSLLEITNLFGTPIQQLQAKAEYTPEFNWKLSLSEKPNENLSILSQTTEDEQAELKEYLYFIRFKKLVTLHENSELVNK